MVLNRDSARRSVVAFIPARGGSKSIPGKNIRMLAGRPLIHWVSLAALGCRRIEKVYVSTDDDNIARVAKQIEDDRLAVIDRGSHTATDEATTESALLEFARAREFETVVLIQATNPFLRTEDLNRSLETMDQAGWDSLLSVTRERRFRWRQHDQGTVIPENYDPANRPMRQQWDGELYENGAFYITQRDKLLESGCRLSGRIGTWEMHPSASLELDELYEWTQAEALIMQQPPTSPDFNTRCKNLKLLLTDVDGVLTDSGMYYDSSGDVLRKFNTRDGKAVELLRTHGVKTGILSTEDSEAVRKRGQKLGMEVLLLGIADKADAIRRLTSELNLKSDEIGFMGDDINDTEALSLVGLAACPSNAHPNNLSLAHYCSPLRGGEGCLRDLAEKILRARREQASASDKRPQRQW